MNFDLSKVKYYKFSMMRSCFLSAALVIGLSVSHPAYALDGLYVSQPEKLKFVIDSGRLYFRNLNEFGDGWKPCCYSYWIDLSTDSGKAQFSLLLTFYSSGRPFSIYKTDKLQDGQIGFLGPT